MTTGRDMMGLLRTGKLRAGRTPNTPQAPTLYLVAYELARLAVDLAVGAVQGWGAGPARGQAAAWAKAVGSDRPVLSCQEGNTTPHSLSCGWTHPCSLLAAGSAGGGGRRRGATNYRSVRGPRCRAVRCSARRAIAKQRPQQRPEPARATLVVQLVARHDSTEVRKQAPTRPRIFLRTSSL
jgi:hypothetical protein